MSNEQVPVPNLRAAAQLSAAEAERLRAAGLRSLPATHELRDLACWSRRVWRPAVRVHALRALVRSPATLASLSARAQDMLFAVFRTVNAANRPVAAQMFGVLLLAEDPWLIDVGGDGTDGDATRAVAAFLRLYDARHKFLGDANAAAGAFADPDLLHRESDALRRHLHHVAPAAKARRIAPDNTHTSDRPAHPLPPPPPPPAPRSESRSLSPMDRIHRFPGFLGEGSSGNEQSVLEARVSELSGEVSEMREELRENARRISHLTSSLDALVKFIDDNVSFSSSVAPHIVSQLKASVHAQSPPRAMEVEQVAGNGGGKNKSVDSGSKENGEGGSGVAISESASKKPQAKARGDASSAKPPSGLHEHEHTIPTLLSPELAVRKPVTQNSTSVQPVASGQPATGPMTADERRRMLEDYDLESFRNMVAASPWTFLPDSGRTESAGPPVRTENTVPLLARRTPLRVFRDGRWFEHQ